MNYWLDLVGGLEHVSFFYMSLESYSQLTFMFFRRVETTNQINIW